MERKLERRIIPGTVEIRGAGKAKKLFGYAAIFNSDSEDLGGFIERIAPGAFSDALSRSDFDCRCLFNHDANQLLGRTSSGTLRVSQDSRGLYYECEVPDTQLGRDLVTLAQRGDLTQSSFGFCVADDEWSENYTRRLIVKVRQLFDVSPVTVPAYNAATVQARSGEKAREVARTYLRSLRSNADPERDAARQFLTAHKH